ncbi:MAG TPA: hydrogenase [Thermoanaerobaculia bacterium]|jgi:hydrogenase-4 component E|nr:MAG: Hydrogenase-4 component E [Acidobacteria bacterium ADurb.Bin051]HNU81893.1 hydrogenase [Thermoanaerobaculia bacterium]HQN38645.1 hydrogenase [Thermoanaerobaculia bacterium]
MQSLLEILVAGLLLVNLVALGAGRIGSMVRAVALQGLLLGMIAIVAHGEASNRVLVLALASVVLKAWLIPAMLFRALRQVAIRREVEPLLGLLPSLVLGALTTALAVAAAGRLPFAEERLAPLLVPAALATVAAGLLLLVTRRKAITQVVGYLVLENGIFAFGLLLVEAMPFLVEAGVLLDLFVGIFVLSIIIHHINREFASLDTRRLSQLRE